MTHRYAVQLRTNRRRSSRRDPGGAGQYEVEKFYRGADGKWHARGARRFKDLESAKRYLERFAEEQKEVLGRGIRIDLRERKGRKVIMSVGRQASHYERDKLRSVDRRAFPSRKFALPRRRVLPLVDASHVRVAASSLESMRRRGTVTAAEYREASTRIREAKRRFGIGASSASRSKRRGTR